MIFISSIWWFASLSAQSVLKNPRFVESEQDDDQQRIIEEYDDSNENPIHFHEFFLLLFVRIQW